mmetsp:Transcript_65103/g.201913  ORF Transcript_65103/g.201913 Transcript_65103/m.201913 type:complete len:218 (-) Transcript_65103:723-1376(-)
MRLQTRNRVVVSELVAPVGNVVGHAQARTGELQRHFCKLSMAYVPLVLIPPVVPQDCPHHRMEARTFAAGTELHAPAVNGPHVLQECVVESGTPGRCPAKQRLPGLPKASNDLAAGVREVLPMHCQGEGVHEVQWLLQTQHFHRAREVVLVCVAPDHRSQPSVRCLVKEQLRNAESCQHDVAVHDSNVVSRRVAIRPTFAPFLPNHARCLAPQHGKG